MRFKQGLIFNSAHGHAPSSASAANNVDKSKDRPAKPLRPSVLPRPLPRCPARAGQKYVRAGCQAMAAGTDWDLQTQMRLNACLLN
jgi:hypothetical protein